jgi:hypothetical protein
LALASFGAKVMFPGAAEYLVLTGPFGRGIAKTDDSKPARQATFETRLDCAALAVAGLPSFFKGGGYVALDGAHSVWRRRNVRWLQRPARASRRAGS